MPAHTSTDTHPVYDLAIIGGGIAGTAIARDAALRKWSVVLLEKATLAAGTSSKSSKLIHGGIRYLETAWSMLKKGNLLRALENLRFVFVSLEESRILERLAPDIVKPLPLLIPIYAGDKRSRASIYLGARLYYWLARLTGPARPPKILSDAESALKEVPGLKRDGLIGAVIIWDRIVDDAALVKKLADSAVRHGARVLQGCRAQSYRRESKELYQIVTDSAGTLTARHLINASGPWLDSVRNRPGENLVEPIAGAHIETQAFSPISVILQAGDGRIFFVINRNGTARIGTTERPCSNPDSVEPTENEIHYLLNAVHHYFPSTNLTAADILHKDAGVRPLARAGGETNANAMSREHRITVDNDGTIHVAGVKLTDHRRAAQQVMRILDRAGKCLTAATPLET